MMSVLDERVYTASSPTIAAEIFTKAQQTWARIIAVIVFPRICIFIYLHTLSSTGEGRTLVVVALRAHLRHSRLVFGSHIQFVALFIMFCLA